jgi:hypothetical protein
LPVRRGALLAALPDHQEALHHGRCRTHARTSSTRKARPPRHHRRGPALPITTKTHARACEMDACCYGRDRCLSGRLVLIACSLRRNAGRWRYWMLWPKLANASRWPHACMPVARRPSRGGSRVVSVCPRFHLYPVVTCLSHVVCCTFDTAWCRLHIACCMFTLYALSVPFACCTLKVARRLSHISTAERGTAVLLSVARALVARRLSWPMPSY